MSALPTTNPGLNAHFLALPQSNGTFMATYIWLGNCTEEINLRSKVRTLTKDVDALGLAAFPVWNYDGSSTNQAKTEDSELWIKPIYYCLDPFHPQVAGSKANYLVLCETVLPTPELIPTSDNYRRECVRVHDVAKSEKNEEVCFGLEQEFILTSRDDPTLPLGWKNHEGEGLRPQGPYYCSVGTENAIGRQVSDAHYRACLYAGLSLCGTNFEVFPGQLEYQVGPCAGVDVADQLWMSRYILFRVAELYQVNVTFDPKPVPHLNGSGLHTNFSTKASMTAETGYDAILSYMPKFQKKVKEHMEVYGVGNERRLTGIHETQSLDKFDYAVGSRGCSIRIPTTTFNEKKGYAEDRRPASNADPYRICARITKTCLDIE